MAEMPLFRKPIKHIKLYSQNENKSITSLIDAIMLRYDINNIRYINNNDINNMIDMHRVILFVENIEFENSISSSHCYISQKLLMDWAKSWETFVTITNLTVSIMAIGKMHQNVNPFYVKIWVSNKLST